jgi:hypothetical protein
MLGPVATTIQTLPLQRRWTWHAEPQMREILALTLTGAAIFALVILRFCNYHAEALQFGDSQSYISVANAIRHWDFAGLHVKQFWGYPYAMAALSSISRLPVDATLLIVSFSSCVLSIAFAYRLWGGWVAAFFAVLNFDWLQRSFLGGSEPLAVALIFGAFLAVRKDRFLVAAALASLSTVVRPLGVFSVLAIVTVLLYRRDFKRVAGAILIGAVIAALYAVPLLKYFGDPLATVHSYGGSERFLFGLPFRAILEGLFLNHVPLTNLALSVGWILLVTAGAVMMWRDEAFRAYAREHSVEVLFAVPYLALIYCYNYPAFASGSFARFEIPVLPFVYLALSKWMPRDRRVIWALGIISPALAAASAIGIRNVIAALG